MPFIIIKPFKSYLDANQTYRNEIHLYTYLNHINLVNNRNYFQQGFISHYTSFMKQHYEEAILYLLDLILMDGKNYYLSTSLMSDAFLN